MTPFTPQTSILIPSGPKYLATFKEQNNKPICILYDLVHKIHKEVYVAFDPILTLGTEMYDTLVDEVFVAERLNTYKKKPVSANVMRSYEQITYILDHYIHTSKVRGVIQFKLPFMTNQDALMVASSLNYNVYGIQQVLPRPMVTKLSNYFGHFIIEKHHELFEVYVLYVMQDNERYLYCNAYVNDIKTNYLLRKIFNVKKNYKNIEYSDDETTEENVEKETVKYVTCIYLPSIKKWKPYTFNRSKKVDVFKKIFSYNWNTDSMCFFLLMGAFFFIINRWL